VFEAIKNAGQRAIISKGWGNLGVDGVDVPTTESKPCRSGTRTTMMNNAWYVLEQPVMRYVADD
jgi:hypothetical protein